jgi:chromosome segregation ATPase
MHAMGDKQPISEAIDAQRTNVENATKYKAGLQEALQASINERAALADDLSTYGPHGNPFLEKVDQAIRNLNGQIDTVDQQIQTATRMLEYLERAKERQTKLGASKAQALDEQVQALRATLAELEERGGQLVAAMVDDPDNGALQDDIALNNEKRKATLERLEMYEQAYATALRDDQINASASRTLEAFSQREKAVTLAKQRVAVAEKIDNYLAGLAPLMREWREVDDAVSAAANAAVRAAYAGLDLGTRTRAAEAANLAAARDSIAPAVAQALLVADVQNVTRQFLELRYASSIEARRDPITAKERAAKTVPNLVTRLDEAITRAGAHRG